MSDEHAIHALKEKVKRIAGVLSTPDGQYLLEALKTEFIPDDLLGKDDRETYMNLGRRDVVIYLFQIVKFHEANNE
jgi:hypothetical protein